MKHKGTRGKKKFKECAEIVRAANTRCEPRSCSTMQAGLSTLSRALRRPLGERKKRVPYVDTHICLSVHQPQPTQRPEEGVAGGQGG